MALFPISGWQSSGKCEPYTARLFFAVLYLAILAPVRGIGEPKSP